MDNMQPEIWHPEEDLLIDYADRLLDTAESPRVTAHLESCLPCQRRVKALQESLALTHSLWQDNLQQLNDIQVPIARQYPWKMVRNAAACILLGIGLFWASHHQLSPPKVIVHVPSLEQIERDITQATVAARLLAATDLIAKYPDTKTLVQSQYRHIVEGYPRTQAAQNAKLLIE